MSIESTQLQNDELMDEVESNLKKRAAEGDTEEQYHLANWLITNHCGQAERLEEAFMWAKKSSVERSKAKQLVAECLHEGIGCTEDKKKAVNISEEVLATLREKIDSKSLLESFVEAITSYGDGMFLRMRKAEMGNTLFFLANCYLRGEGIPKNYAKSLAYLNEASELGSKGARLMLAELHVEGRLVSRDLLKAIKLALPYVSYEDMCIKFIVDCYIQLNTPEALIEAYSWSSILAAKQEEEYVARREELEEKMDIKQVIQAQEKADEYWKKCNF